MSSILGAGGGYETFLIHSVEVRRRSGVKDRFGQPVDANPGQLASAVPVAVYPGRLDRGRGGYVNQERSIDIYEVRHMLFMATDADVREDDSVRVFDPLTEQVLLPDAKVMLKNLVYVNTEPHHLELTVSVQRGPQ